MVYDLHNTLTCVGCALGVDDITDRSHHRRLVVVGVQVELRVGATRKLLHSNTYLQRESICYVHTHGLVS